jgi:RHS repeat-associated protein
VAIATDTSGNTKQETFDVLVIDPTDVEAPTVSFQLEGINDGDFVKSPTSIRATITDDGSLDYYRLLVAPIDGGEFKELWRNDNPTAINNGLLVEKFDPSLLQNDSYIVRLEVADNGGKISYSEQVVDVAGELKLGNFRLSFTDLTVPVTGIPITLTRTYDTLNSNTTDDFGYGWRMEFRDTDLRTSLRTPSEEDQLIGYQSAFKDGTKVYITLPGGQRQAFTFKPTIDPQFRLLANLGGSNEIDSDPYVYRPAFVGEFGVTSTLTVKDARILHKAGTSEYVGLNGGVPYNPADINFGSVYVLTTKEGIVYEIDAKTGDLLTVTDTNGNKLTYTDDAIASSTGQKITFERDASGRIKSVKDPMGELIRYEYDAQGDLVSVTDRESNTTRMEYNQERSHYLDKIIDPLGRTGVRNEYGDDGRLKQMVDANGKAVQLAYDPSHSTETITDQLGNPTTYEYDERGNVVTEIDALGGIKKRIYDENNNLLSQTDPQGNSYTYSYDNANNLTSVTDPLGNTTHYTFNKFGEVLTKTNPLGNTTTYVYGNRGNRLSLTNAEGSLIKYSFDGKGRPSSIMGADGSITQFQYDSLGNLTTEIDALGHQTTYTYDSNGNQLSETKTVTLPNGLTTLTTRWTYDASNHVTSITDTAGNITREEYDQLGNLSASIDPLGHRTEYIYDAKGKQIKTLYADGTVEQSVYDAAGQEITTIDQTGNTTNFVYDALGRLIKIIYADATPDDLTDNPTTSTEYNIAGHITAQIDERGNRTQYQYDADGRQTVVEDALGNKTTYTYNAANNPLSETDALNHTTQYTYDALGRKIGTKLADGTTTSITYDSVGRRNSSTDQANRTTHYVYDSLNRITEVIDPMGYHTTSAYDELGRLISQTDANNHTTKYEYDTLGRRTALINALGNKTTYTYDAVGNQLSGTDALNHTTQFIYDVMNRPVETIFADGSHMDTTYDALGREIAMTDQMGITTSYEYDVQGRLISVLDALKQHTTYSYNQAGDLTSQTDANGHTTNYEYDALNRRTATVLPLGQRSTTNYDAVGNVLSTTDANGHTINYQYDTLNHLVQEQFADRSKVNYTYTVTGKIATVSDSRGVTSYTYDSKDRLLSRSDPDGQKIQYTYDAVNNRTSVTVPSGTTNYTFDALNRMASVTDSSQGVTRYLYDAVGNLVETDLANNTVETRAYDNLNHLISLENKNLAGLISSYHYTLNAMGMRTAVDENGGRHVQYSYDKLHRLTQEAITDLVEGNRITSYTFDTNGNRLTRNDSVDGLTTYDYDNNDRLLSETLNGQVTTYTYDNNGNTLSRFKSASDQTNYTWDDQNRMIGATVTDSTGTHQMSYGYNSEGIRVASVVDGQETRYLVDANRAYTEVLEEYTASGTVQASYVYGLGLISQSRAGVLSFYEKDGLGSTRILTDASGSVTDTYTYDAFGNQIASTGTTVNNYRYTGEQYDSKLGNYYLRQRYYDPKIGRFNRKDIYEGNLNQPASLHKYIYTESNPVNRIDPSGMFSMTEETATLIGLDALEAASGSTVTATTTTTLGAGTFPEAVSSAVPEVVNVGRAAISISARISINVARWVVETATLLGEIESIPGIPTIVFGKHDPVINAKTTEHIFDALTGNGDTKLGNGTSPPFLLRIKSQEAQEGRLHPKGWQKVYGSPENPGGTYPLYWYEAEPQCRFGIRKFGGDGLVCDEYPFASTAQGGYYNYQNNTVSIRLVPEEEQLQGFQGSQFYKIGQFYSIAGVSPRNPYFGWFVVATTEQGGSYWIDRKLKPREFTGEAAVPF